MRFYSSFLDTCIQFFKLIKEIILKFPWAFVHTTVEDLYKHIPQEQLLREYDEKAPSIAELMAHWKSKFESDESLKPTHSFATDSQCNIM